MAAGAGEPLICGVDLGTSSVKAIIFALDGEVVAAGARPTRIVSVGPGAAEFDADALWQATAAAIKDAVAGLDDAQRLGAIAVASFAESGVALDAAGNPVALSHAWYDKRPAAQTAWLRQTYGAVALGLKSGMGLDPVPGLAKLLWLRDTDPDGFARMIHWLSMADFIAWHLSGEMATDPSLAVRTLAFDLANEGWNDALLADLDLTNGLLPRVAANGEPLGPVTSGAARATGLPENCLVVVGGHDHVVGGMAAGAMDRAGALDSIGTAEAYVRAIDRPITDPRVIEWGFEQGVLRIGRPIRFLTGGLITASASVEWFRREVAGGEDYEALIAAAEEVPPGANGAVFVPHLRLGSPPDVDAGAAGAFLGLTTETDRACLFRALLEGLAFDLRNIAEHSAELAATAGTPPPEHLRVIGGGARNRLLLAIKAAIYGRPLEVLVMPESTSLGAALLAGLGAGFYGDIDRAIAAVQPAARVVAPEPEWVAQYEAFYRQRYLPAVAALRVFRAGPVSEP